MADSDFTRAVPKAAGDKMVSELPIVTSVTGNSWLVINVNGITSRIRPSDLLGN